MRDGETCSVTGIRTCGDDVPGKAEITAESSLRWNPRRKISASARVSLGCAQTRQRQQELETRARSTWRRRVRSCRFMPSIKAAGSPAGQECPQLIPHAESRNSRGCDRDSLEIGPRRRAAEEELHLSPPALSETVRDLERELGVDLLERRRSGAKVSDEGRELLPHVMGVLDAVDRLRSAAGDQRRISRTVRLGTVDTATAPLVIPTVWEFRAAHPRTRAPAHPGRVGRRIAVRDPSRAAGRRFRSGAGESGDPGPGTSRLHPRHRVP